MPGDINPPNVEQLHDLAEALGLELTAADAKSYRDPIGGAMRVYRRLDEMVEYRPPVKYPRTVGHRPEAQDNPSTAGTGAAR